MTEPRAQRTLVKSPPELWAEISDPKAIARHLGELGEIRITRTDPETTVAWEGDRVRGTVELEASGWGTKVTLTAELARQEPVEEEVAAAPVAAPARAADPLLGGRRPGLLGRFRRRPRGVAPEPPTGEPPVEGRGVRVEQRLVPPAGPAGPAAPATTPTATAPPAPPAPDVVEAVLVGVLDDLGSAQKRPFSR